MGRILCGMIVLGLACGALAAEPSNLDEVGFLAGSWLRSDERSSSEEHWLAERGGMMLGLYRKVRTSGKVSFEYLRLERREDGIYYVANPDGQPEASFKLIESKPGRAVFENPDHDFPTRIIYVLESDGSLTARIEGEIDGAKRESEWHWTRSADAFVAP